MNRSARQGNPPARSPRMQEKDRGGRPHSPAAGDRRAGSRAGDGAAGSSPSQHRAARSKRHLEGVLNKYTNLLQGWQNRYFVLDPEVGQLQYYLNEHSGSQRPPRGSLPLLGASVVSGDEFPHMFTVHSVNGDAYKLRASDAQEQQLWMTQLQLCSRRHSDSSAKASCTSSSTFSSSSSPPGRTRSFSLHPHPPPAPPASSSSIQRPPPPPPPTSSSHLLHHHHHHLHHPGAAPGSIVTVTHHQSPGTARRARINQQHHPGRLREVREVMSQAEGQQKNLVNSIESLPPRGGPLSSLDEDLLLLKATSAATLSCLGECLSMLQHNVSQALNQNLNQNQNQNQNHVPSPNSPTGWSRSPSEKQVKNGGVSPLSSSPSPSSTQRHKDQELSTEGQSGSPEALDPSEETTDMEDNEEEDLGVLDDQRSIILHLLSQLKLGMDLTRVVLPTFILEKRSLLEMYANFMAHPDMFLSITAGSTPEDRIVRFVEYYLTAFHEGRKGAVAKKPYNPILGENFRCSWDVPRDRVRPLRTNNSTGPNSVNSVPTTAPTTVPGSSQRGTDGGGGGGGHSDCYRVRFVAEQVSHHPPVSGFYCECKERRMCINTHVWTKSKFMGMSVGVSMVGEGVLYLLEHDEEYVFTLPCAYARSILTVPWVELGGKVTISCAKSGYSATVTFHTKPFYGGKVHRVTAEVKHNQTGAIVCKAQGEWNGTLEFTYSSGETKVIDTSKLPIIKKKIRPLEKQGQYESRRLWQHVTASLKAGNMDAATEHKHRLEERQRSEGKQRAATKTPWKPKYFIKEGEGWVYHNPLWKTH
uniref:oxysterol-binding protein-related protein 10 n=1 Tax=Centroberyx gerrardi TaxID=166262 RepID=UPI003AAAB304